MGAHLCRQPWQRALLLTATLTCLIRRFGVAEASSQITDELVDLEEQYAAVSNGSLLWLQRPNLYFGMKARVQGDSPLFGLAWFGAHDYAGLQSASHPMTVSILRGKLRELSTYSRTPTFVRARRQHGWLQLARTRWPNCWHAGHQ